MRFRKEHHFFMFDKARRHIFEKNKAYIFEGYLDSLMLSQVGLLNSVAIMGTSLGYRKIGLLARYCDEVCLCFDNDANDAGLMGQLKSMSDLHSFGFGTVSKVVLPQGVDPDEFVVQNSLDAFLEREEKITEKDMKDAMRKYDFLRSSQKQGKGA